MLPFCLSVLLAFCTLLSGASVSSAVIVESTDPAFPGGTNNVNFDTETDLEWLDWSASFDISFDAMTGMLGAGGTYAGWRHATDAELQTFLTNLGLNITNWPSSTTEPDGGASVIAAVGIVGSGGGTQDLTFAFYAEPDGTRQETVRIQHPTGSSIVTTQSFPTSSAGLNIGHALVRAIPEPSGFLFGCSVTTSMALLGQRRSVRR